VPTVESLNVDGLDLTGEQLRQALDVDHDEWAAELPLIEDWFATIGDKVPSTLRNELDTLKAHLEARTPQKV